MTKGQLLEKIYRENPNSCPGDAVVLLLDGQIILMPPSCTEPEGAEILCSRLLDLIEDVEAGQGDEEVPPKELW